MQHTRNILYVALQLNTFKNSKSIANHMCIKHYYIIIKKKTLIFKVSQFISKLQNVVNICLLDTVIHNHF